MLSPAPAAESLSALFFVDWHLLDGCNHECSYNHEPPSALQERYLRDPLLETAYRILSWKRPAYLFHFYGGEPTIHPHFPELFRYVATTGENIRSVLDTNGLRSLAYYTKLFQGLPHGTICCNIDVHLKYLVLDSLLYLMALILEQGQYCRLIVNDVPEYSSQAQNLYQKILLFRQRFPFSLEIRLPLGGDITLPQEVIQAFEKTGTPLALPHWAITARMPLAAPQHGGSDMLPYCCPGTNSVHVTPDGRCTLGLMTKDIPFQACVRKRPLMKPCFPPLPAFSQQEEAEAWLQDFRRTSLRQELDGGAVRHPLHPGIDEEQRLRLRLKHTDVSGCTTAHLDVSLWQEGRDKLLQLWNALENENDRDLFARHLKASLLAPIDTLPLTEEGTYLQEHDCPATPAQDSLLVFEEDVAEPLAKTPETASEYDAPYPTAEIALPEDNIPAYLPKQTMHDDVLRLSPDLTAEDFATLLPKIQWYHPEIILPLAGMQWVDSALLLHEALPEYKLHLHDDGDGGVLMAAQPERPRLRRAPLPPRPDDGTPLVSIILPAASDEEALRTSLESALAQPLERLEVIVILDCESAPTTGATADIFARKAPWKVHPFRFEESMGMQAAWNAGLDMAQGDYACLLPCGDVFHGEMLSVAVATLEKEQAELASFFTQTTTQHVLDGSLALARFLSGQIGDSGLYDKVYATLPLRKYALAGSKGGGRDDSFNFQFLHLAGKVITLPGQLIERATEDSDASPVEQTRNFFDELEIAFRFRAAHDMPDDDMLWAAWARRHFQAIRPALRQATCDADGQELLTDSHLALLARIPGLLDDLAAELPVEKNCMRPMPPADSSASECLPYGGAAIHTGTPTLSIILTVQSKPEEHLLECLQSLDGTVTECLLIANGCDAATRRLLEDTADMYPHIRLFYMQTPAHPAHCRNAGLARAQGEGVFFLDATDELLPNFIPEAVRALRENTADICAFAVRRMDADSMLDFSFFKEDINTGAKLAAFFLEKDMPLDGAGMLFRRAHVQDLRYSPAAPRWKESFVLAALCHARACMNTNAALNLDDSQPQMPDSFVPLAEMNCYFDQWQSLLDQHEAWTSAARKALFTFLENTVKDVLLSALRYDRFSNKNVAAPCLIRTLLTIWATL